MICEKKILGYELIKEYPNSKQIGYFEKYTTGYLSRYPEFWKPIYAGDYKVGDWITVIEIKDKFNWLNATEMRTFQLTHTPTIFYGGPCWSTSGPEYPPNTGVGSGIPEDWFRKATPEEIANSGNRVISMHSSNKGNFQIYIINGKAYYKPENKLLDKEWIKDIIDKFHTEKQTGLARNPYEIKVNYVDVGCFTGTRKEDWEKVYSALK